MIKPRVRGYVHRPIISVVNGVGMLETGEVIFNLPLFAYNNDAHLWVTLAPVEIARSMRDYFGEYPWFCLGGSNAIDPDPDVQKITPHKGYIGNFGFDSKHGGSAPNRRKSARHVIYSPARTLGDIKKSGEMVQNNHASLQLFLSDIREWCKENDIPMGKTLASIGSALLRDKRFWPEDRGRVPRETNERLREFLPAVHNQLHAETNSEFNSVISLDQRRAYHTIAQEVETPDPNTLFARGRFTDSREGKLWTRPGKPVYERTVTQPGLLAVRGTSRPTRLGEVRLPALDFTGTKTVYLWSNELTLAREQGFHVEGLTAAWTSKEADKGLPKYGKWALEQINASGKYRQQWLKPALHSTYGLLGSRSRTIEFVEHSGKSEDMTTWYFRGYKFEFHRRTLEDFLPVFANTAMLGVLQAEVRARTFRLASELIEHGGEVLHTHADGIHVVIDQLPLCESFSGDRWTVDALTRLTYLDKVSYICNEKSCLPGRTRWQRMDIIEGVLKDTKTRKWLEMAGA